MAGEAALDGDQAQSVMGTAIAAQKIISSPDPGMCGKNRYLEYTALPVT